MQKWAVWVPIALGVFSLGLLIYVDAPILEERLGISGSGISIVFVATLRWAGLSLAITVGVALLLFATPKVWNVYLDLRHDRPAQRRFKALWPLLVECQQAIDAYAVGTSPGHSQHDVNRRLAVADEKSLQLNSELNKLGVTLGTEDMTAGLDWREYLARLAVRAERGDLQGARLLKLRSMVNQPDSS